MDNQWWGYIHTNGSLQVKRYFDKQDLVDAYESPFVSKVFQPFPAADAVHAKNQMKRFIAVEQACLFCATHDILIAVKTCLSKNEDYDIFDAMDAVDSSLYHQFCEQGD